MHVPATQRVLEAFERQNSFLRAALGVASSISVWDALLQRHVPAAAEAREAESLPAPAEQLLHALLGAVLLKTRVEEVFSRAPAAAAADGDADAANAPKPSAAALRGLLR